MILEYRTYLLKPGTVPNFMQRFEEGLSARQQFSPLGGIWHSDVGTLNQVVHVWPYDNFEARERIGQEARKTGKWPPKTQEFILFQDSKILLPAPFSPPLEKKRWEISTRSASTPTSRARCRRCWSASATPCRDA